MAVAETLAEKVLSFLRRYSLHRSGRTLHTWDTTLVRHIYDVHCIVSQMPEKLPESVNAFSLLLKGDVKEFGYQDISFEKNPRQVLIDSLRHAAIDIQIRNEYNEVLLPLVFGASRHPFSSAWTSFEKIAIKLINSL